MPPIPKALMAIGLDSTDPNARFRIDHMELVDPERTARKLDKRYAPGAIAQAATQSQVPSRFW
jgi:hypothetical protein